MDAHWRETVQITLAISFYFVSSISVVFLNKFLLSGWNFSYPVFVTWFQLVVAFGCLYVLGTLGQFSSTFTYFRPLEFDLAIARKVFPLTLIFVGMVTFNNLCLLYVEVSFYLVARSLTICFSIAFTWFILDTVTSVPAIQASVVVFLGFVVGSIGELNFSVLGVLYGVLSSVFVALYGIYVKKIIAVVDNDEQRLIIYNTVMGMFLLLPVSFLFGELQPVLSSPLLRSPQFWYTMTVTGVMGFLINIATYLQIKYTSPLTHSISGTAKACVQTVLGVLIWRNPISLLNAAGICLTVVGSFLYGYVRYAEMKLKSAGSNKDTSAAVAPLNPTSAPAPTGKSADDTSNTPLAANPVSAALVAASKV